MDTETIAQVTAKLRAKTGTTDGHSFHAPKVKCDVCDDTGWVSTGLFHLMNCPNCTDPRAMTRSGLRYGEQKLLTWDNVQPLQVRVIVRGKERSMTALDMSHKIRDYLANSPGGFILMSGGYGQAKSLMLKIAVAEALRSGLTAQYMTMSSILDVVRDAYDSTDPRDSALARTRTMQAIGVLAIDEIDKVKFTDWAAERAFQLIDSRYDAAMYGGMVTLLACNVMPNELAGLASRASDGRALYIQMVGQDVRPTMAW